MQPTASLTTQPYRKFNFAPNVRYWLWVRVKGGKQKYFLEQVSEPGAKIQCRECNTFAIVRIHVQMFQAMSVQI